jgi:PDZ domain-containing protein
VSLRVRTLLVGGVLFVVLFFLAAFIPVPYVIFSPGPTLNTLSTDLRGRPIIAITGHPTNPTSGHLNLTTVGVNSNRVTPFRALFGWLQHDREVVPRSSVFPPGQSEEQVNKVDTAQFVDSQSSATAAAFCQLQYPSALGVVAVIAGTGADGKLKPFDQLLTLNGQSIDTQPKIAAVLAEQTPGETAQVHIKRASLPMTVAVTLSKPSDGGRGARLGVTVGQQCFAPYQVDLGLADQIGGPSAGLMFALGIMDKVGPTDLTAGRFIAGTGEIQPDGKVLPIGGIQLKMIAARRAGATIFLAPQDNCGDVREATPSGLDVIKVTSLGDAVSDLQASKDGKAVPHC